MQQNNVIKLQSFVHYQFSATRYEHMIRYAFNKSGYNEVYNIEEFETPAEYSFGASTSMCNCLNCLAEGTETRGFGRYGHCCNSYCFNHFYGIDTQHLDYHTCLEGIFEI